VICLDLTDLCEHHLQLRYCMRCLRTYPPKLAEANRLLGEATASACDDMCAEIRAFLRPDDSESSVEAQNSCGPDASGPCTKSPR
jgi:hypothetical protein